MARAPSKILAAPVTRTPGEKRARIAELKRQIKEASGVVKDLDKERKQVIKDLDARTKTAQTALDALNKELGTLAGPTPLV